MNDTNYVIMYIYVHLQVAIGKVVGQCQSLTALDISDNKITAKVHAQLFCGANLPAKKKLSSFPNICYSMIYTFTQRFRVCAGCLTEQEWAGTESLQDQSEPSISASTQSETKYFNSLRNKILLRHIVQNVVHDSSILLAVRYFVRMMLRVMLCCC